MFITSLSDCLKPPGVASLLHQCLITSGSKKQPRSIRKLKTRKPKREQSRQTKKCGVSTIITDKSKMKNITRKATKEEKEVTNVI